MSKHTPGPWRHLDDRERSGRHEILATDRTVATIKWYDARSVADARLIAAAPDGKALAERVMECSADCPLSVVDLARAFLAKAEGKQ